ncbi:regulator of cell morphogenesis and NO signaling [Capnocytophaga haemolytica]|jgi:iron-sulfur cluster repair di-iron protein|uniref:Iron-sulfur cluster repair di-iron protein n=1 Tax=Capnocytophaga haemolytica TaxID=45243 RepID=A0AAX2GWG8_9FLAO|nr:iron-sulfur cluster repair di-iron protein [Capnocytophaga haemolytica]AMD84898.1 iron-sulfur cluster repair di-iron protein [Capnocytophaga haemolytica]SFN77758.1 regulator of cell morphogenesis and NO signaling [Capnocytophaga haemolytica]SNV06554.1 Regulator of cell morphogenesis and NO signaling [Capnocytophaga haemolytica]
MSLTDKTIGEIVADDFRAAAVFKKYGIDFCCRGGRTIDEACDKKDVDKQSLINDLNAIPQGKGDQVDVSSWPLDLLANYIVRIHHQYVHDKTPILLQFLDKLCRVHGERHPELFEINRIFTESAHDLANHFEKEERVLFPFIGELVKAQQTGQPLETAHFGTVENPIAMMMHEHTVEGDRFAEIARLSNNYTPPADACNTYRVTFAMLQEFEEDLHRHIHLENNVLFPKAIALEKQLNS